MHGLVFKTSICYWQDQPGYYPVYFFSAPNVHHHHLLVYTRGRKKQRSRSPTLPCHPNWCSHTQQGWLTSKVLPSVAFSLGRKNTQSVREMLDIPLLLIYMCLHTAQRDGQNSLLLTSHTAEQIHHCYMDNSELVVVQAPTPIHIHIINMHVDYAEHCCT